MVRQILGHATATMTLDRYGHLFPDRLDEVAEAMDAARVKATAAADEGDSARTAERMHVRRGLSGASRTPLHNEEGPACLCRSGLIFAVSALCAREDSNPQPSDP